MKKLKRILLLLCISCTLFACSSSNKDEEYRSTIVGCWRQPGELESFTYYVVFNEDSTYYSYTISDVGFKTLTQSSSGKYEINNGKIKCIPDNGTITEVKIEEMTNENFILQEGNNRATVSRISQEEMNQILSETYH